MISKPVKLAWLATHPIQYQAPLLKALSDSGDFELTVLFFSDFSTRDFVDPEFGKRIEWDTPLLDGYKYEFLRGTGRFIREIKTFQPLIFGMKKKLIAGKFDAVIIQGWNHYGMILGAFLAKKIGIKVFLRCEASDHVLTSTGIKKVFRECVVRKLFKNTDYFMSIGRNNRQFYLNRNVDPGRIGLMPYCVNNDFFMKEAEKVDIKTMRRKLGIDLTGAIILFAGKFIKRKYPDVLLDAYAQLNDPKPHLLFVGDGELHGILRAKVKELNLDKVHFMGFLNQTELPKFYALADIFVLPSKDETWGLVVNEAMNAGCAIIAGDGVGSSADLVENDRNGVICKSGDTYSLHLALMKCLKDKNYKTMGKESLKIIKNWGIAENVRELTKFLAPRKILE